MQCIALNSTDFFLSAWQLMLLVKLIAIVGRTMVAAMTNQKYKLLPGQDYRLSMHETYPLPHTQEPLIK